MPTQTGSLDLKGLKQTYNKTIAVVQPIYCRTDSSTAPANSTRPTTVKIIKTDDTGTTAPSSNGDGWTTMLMARICSSNVNYKFLWTCQQLLAADGTVLGCTSIVEDKGTTIIDGDTVTTGTVNVGRLNVADVITAINENGTTTINGGKITTNSLQIGHVQNLQSNLTSSANTANSYIAYINATDGIKVAAASPSSTTSNYVQITSSGINIIKDSTNKAAIDADGMKVYKGDASNPVAQFGTTSYIGKHDGSQSYLQMDYHSLVMNDKELNPYFEVTDLRETDGRALLSEIFYYNDSLRFTVGFVIDSVDSVFVGSSQLSSSYYTVGESAVTIKNYTPVAGAKIQINYYTRSSETKSYTFGIRNYEDYTTVPIGGYSIAEGYKVTAGGPYSHAEGYRTFALGSASHAEGISTTAYGINSHAEGGTTFANGEDSHAEGGGTYANGHDSHAEGNHTYANGQVSHAQGMYTTANGYCETVIGRYNILSNSTGQDSYDTSNSPYILVLGNGNGDESSSDYRHNALTVDWFGNLQAAGNITSANLQVISPTVSFSSPTTGTLNTYTCRKYGNIVQLHIRVRNTVATSSGGDIFKCTVDTTTLRPQMVTTSATYYGTYPIAATFGTTGEIIVRNSSTSSFAVPTGTNYVNVSFTYIVA